MNQKAGRAVLSFCIAMMAAGVPCVRAQGYLFGRASYATGGTGEGPAAVAVGDFNGDGIADLAVVEVDHNTVAILLGKPGGTFAPAVFYDTGNQPDAVAVGDFNGDDRQDLAIANRNCRSVSFCGANGSISILPGNGDGTFAARTDLASGTQPVSLAVGDFNNDGRADLAAGNGDLNSLTVLLGNGDGTFQTPVVYSTSAPAVALAAADFNGDGRLDLAVAASGGAVLIFLGVGDGTLQQAAGVPVLQDADALAVGDFNGDGRIDIAATYSEYNAVSILLGAGDGTFQPRVDYTTGFYPVALAVSDFNGDGRLDVAVVNDAGENCSVLLGNGDGTLGEEVEYRLPSAPTAVAVGDFNRDGKPDLAVALSALGAVSIVTGRGDGTFPNPVAYSSSLAPWAVVAGDFNGDGKLDLVTTNLGDNSLSILFGAGDGTFQLDGTFAAGPVPVAAAVADFNRDGKLDVAVVNQTCTSLPCGPGSVSMFLGNGDGTFQTRSDYTVGNVPVSVVVGDFNGDGFADLAVVNNGFGSGNSVSVLLGRGDGTFRSGTTLTTGLGPTEAAAADFDSNGTLDLAVTSSRGVSILRGNGDGTFGSRSDYSLSNAALAVAVGAFNQDGKLDLAVTTTAGVVILLGNGSGGFTTGASYSLAPAVNLQAIVVGDFSGDGKPDLVVGETGDAVSLLVGNGDGTFQAPLAVVAGNAVHGWVAGDFDGDGSLDLAAASVDSNAVFVALNTPVVALYPADLAFGPQTVDTAGASQAVTLSNPSGALLKIARVAASGSFTVANGCPATLSPQASCTLGVSFGPVTDGDAAGTLVVNDNAPGSPQIVALRGTGAGGPAISLSPARLSFSAQSLGTTSAAQTVTVHNTGNAPLSITAVAASGDFAATDNCVPSLAAGAECTVAVTFTSTVVGNRTGVLSIGDSLPSSPQAVALAGIGAASPVASLSVSTLAFGDQRVGTTSAPQSVTVRNNGNAPLAISAITATSEFGVSHNCPASVAPGAGCVVSVSFTPSVTGSVVGALNLADNATDSPQSVALTGAGIAPQASLSPSSVNFAAQVVGATSHLQQLTLSNPGNAALTIAGATLAGADSGDFSVQNSCGNTLGPGASCTLGVTFVPASSGNRTATLSVSTDATASPHAIPLSGTGMDFTLGAAAGSASTLTVAAGQPASFRLTLAPAGIRNSVSLVCAGAPAKSACQVSPATVALDGTTPVEVAVSVETTAASATVLPKPRGSGGARPAGQPVPIEVLFIALLVALTISAVYRRRPVWGLGALLFAVALIAGCGGGGQVSTSPTQSGTPAGTYTLTVTAASPEVTHSVALTLTVRN